MNSHSAGNKVEETKVEETKSRTIAPDSLRGIFQYCDSKSLVAALGVSRDWRSAIMENDLGKKILSTAQSRLSLEQAEALSQELQLALSSIHRYLEVEHGYLTTRGCLDHRFRSPDHNFGYIGGLVFLLFFLGMSGYTSFEINHNRLALSDAQDLYRNTIVNGTSCSSLLSTYSCVPKNHRQIPDLCMSLCKEVLTCINKNIAFGIGLTMFLILLICELCLIARHSSRYFYEGPNRFDEVPINKFSSNVVSAANDMFRRNPQFFRQNNPLNQIAGQVRTEATSAQRKVNKKLKKANAKIVSLREELKLSAHDRARVDRVEQKADSLAVVVHGTNGRGARFFASDSASMRISSSSSVSKQTKASYGSLDDDSNLSMSTPLLGASADSSVAIDLDDLKETPKPKNL